MEMRKQNEIGAGWWEEDVESGQFKLYVCAEKPEVVSVDAIPIAFEVTSLIGRGTSLS